MSSYQPPLTDEELCAAWIFDEEMELDDAGMAEAAAPTASEQDGIQGSSSNANAQPDAGRRKRRKRKRGSESTEASANAVADGSELTDAPADAVVALT